MEESLNLIPTDMLNNLHFILGNIFKTISYMFGIVYSTNFEPLPFGPT